MTDFERINGPRVTKVAAMLSVIHKSATSNKIDREEVVNLMAPLQPTLELLGVDGSTTERSSAPPVLPAEGWHYRDILKNVNGIPENQLSAYATQVMARLCERFETQNGN